MKYPYAALYAAPLITLVLALAMNPGCASTSTRADRGEPSPAQESEPLAAGPRVPTNAVAATSERAPASASDSAAAPGPLTDAAGAPASDGSGIAPIKRRSDELLVRGDGRPSWWFADTVRTDDRVLLCAEALGPDMMDARRSAVESARQKMRDTLGLARDASIPDEHIEHAWVWPLPNASVPEARYAAYVKISSRRYR